MQTSAAQNPADATLYGAAGEAVDFQVGVQSPINNFTIDNFSVTPLTGSSGTIPSADVVLYREWYITIQSGQHSTTNAEGTCGPAPWAANQSTVNLPYCGDGQTTPGTGGNLGTVNTPITNVNTFPDALIPFIDPATANPPSPSSAYVAVPVNNLSADTNTVFWAEVHVPLGIPAGTYTGTYTVTTSGGNVTGNISLTVWGFALPLQPSLKSLFDGAANPNANQAGIEAELLRNKLMPDHQNLANASADLQMGLNTYDPGYFDGVSYGQCDISYTPFSVSVPNSIKGQPGVYLADISSDSESSCLTDSTYNQHIVAVGAALHQNNPSINNEVTTQPILALFSDGTGSGRSAVDDWSMLPINFDIAQLDTTDVENGQPNAIASVLAHGDDVWSYNTLVQDPYSPKRELDFLPINYRIGPGFVGWSLGITGIGYWAVANWASGSSISSPPGPGTGAWNAWTNPASAGFNTSGNYYPGEAILVYPGAQAGLQGVAPSMRLKYIRDGVQDYEYLVQLGKNCGAYTAPAQTTMNLLSATGMESPNFHDWTMTAANLESARVMLGEQINNCIGAPLTVSMTAPANNATVTGTITLSATASGGVGGVASVQFIIDQGYPDQQTVGTITSPPYSVTFNTGTLSPAWYNITAVATDTQNNTASSTISVQVQ